jgi:hypothetical protein
MEAHANAKKPWTMKFKGQIENDFLFGTLLAKDVLPFAIKQYSLVVLPIRITQDEKTKMIDSDEALATGFTKAYDWFKLAEETWDKYRNKDDYTIYQRLNYDSLLTKQPVKTHYYVLYNQSGKNLSAAVLDTTRINDINGIPIQGFVVDSKCYWYATESLEEAHYLVGILNSNVVNNSIKPLQTHGLKGERDIHRRPFEACNIPTYNSENIVHKKISNIAIECHDLLSLYSTKMKGLTGKMRTESREIVVEKLHKLNELVEELLKKNPMKMKRKKGDDAQISLF